MTGNSGFFKLVHHGNFLAVISSNTCETYAGESTVLPISRVEWAYPTQIFMMAQNVGVSVSSLITVRLVAKSVAVTEVSLCLLLHDCTSFFYLEQLPN